jgi:hypothetical protein
MLRLIVTVRRGVASVLPEAWKSYPTVEAAKAAAGALMRDDRVAHVMIVSDELQPHYVDWAA